MNLSLIKLNISDVDKFIELIRLFEMVFEMEDLSIPDKKHLHNVLNKPDFIAFAALDKGEVIGGLTAYILKQYYASEPLAFIYDIAVKASYQRRGIGKALIKETAAYCRKNNIEQMFVLADEEDEQAIGFYRSTNASESKVVNFDYYLKGDNEK